MQLKRQNGFTLVELTLAMTLFSVILLVMTAGVLQLYHIYEAGHEIRDTQEAARSIAQDVTNDTHDALAVAVGTQNGQSSICLYKTIQQQNSTLTGVVYYIAPHDGNPGAPPAVHRASISTPYAPPAPPSCTGTQSADTVLTSTAVTAKVFQASVAPAANPRLVSLAMSMESSYAQLPGDLQPDPLNPGFDQCAPGSGTQYCSITDIQLSALNHSESSL